LGERIDYLDEPEAPKANSLVPSAHVIVVNDQGEILMIRRTDTATEQVPAAAWTSGSRSTTQLSVRPKKRPGSLVRSQAWSGSTPTPAT
jgi:hypothetical protein